MHTWKSHLRSVLYRLARTHGNNNVADVERLLCEVFDAKSVRFLDAEDRPMAPDRPLRDALLKPFQIELNIEFQPQHHRPTAGDALLRRDDAEASSAGPTGFRADVTLDHDEQIDWFVREFDRLEQTHEFMWAGYIVKEMFAKIGLTPPEAREMLDELHGMGIVSVRKVPNPKNPEHPASAVTLIREHERVGTALASGGAASDEAQAVPSESSSAQPD